LNYENELKILYQEKEAILEQIDIEKNKVWNPERIDFDKIKNALQMWKDGDIDVKKKLISNIFPEWIPVTAEKHLWTPKLSLVYEILEAWKNDELELVYLISQNLHQLC
jgi:hypothetical protein